jgi:hypothetical protein
VFGAVYVVKLVTARGAEVSVVFAKVAGFWCVWFGVCCGCGGGVGVGVGGG